MVLRGIVVSGHRNFSKHLRSIPHLLEAYENKIGMRLFHGTLNIKLDVEYSIPQNVLRLEKEEYGGDVSVSIVPCVVFGRRAFILRTDRIESGVGIHPKNIVEIVSDIKFRERYLLKDGDIVEVVVGD
jgi:CTP-dependent riboflavin kinase